VAHIDNLIEKIAEPALRDQLAKEVANLVARTDFGLVFQRHLPEDIEVPGMRPRAGDIVRIRADDSRQRHLVVRAAKDVATLIVVDAAGQVHPATSPTEHPFGEVVVIKDFSQPIYPGLKPLASSERGGSKPTHVVLKGENYYALETLLYTHEGAVDLVYIDPPYNTGADEWIYNDRFVVSADSYRHSKWLSFMERRLIHAKRLLKDTGVLVVAIGDDEHHRLRLLLDQVFGDHNFLANLAWQGGVSALAKHTGGGLDYMLVYARNREAHIRDVGQWRDPKPGAEEVVAVGARFWSESGNDPTKATELLKAWWRPNRKKFDSGVSAYDRIDETGRIYFAGDLANGVPRPNLQYDILHPVTKRPVRRPDNGWRHEPDKMRANIDAGLVLFGPDETTIPTLKRYLDDYLTQVPAPSFYKDRRASTLHLTSVLGGKLFPNPKDHEVLMRWFRMLAGREAVILDFFGGSGTTTEAVLRLNAEDGGARQSILITNNELSKASADRLARAGVSPGEPAWEAEGVFEKVTWPRVETVATGLRPDGSMYSEGFNENIVFYELTYEDENLVALGKKFQAIAPILWLKTGGVGPVLQRTAEEPWLIAPTAVYAILFDPSHAQGFANAVMQNDTPIRHVFVVTDHPSTFETAVGFLPTEHRIGTTRLYSDFIHTFEINGKG
jgi:adenine-specific DNA-methyltransferase